MPRLHHQNHSSLMRSSRLDDASTPTARSELHLAGSEMR
jgi:hypothetical protein